MEQIPDAPNIREAETFGYPPYNTDPVYCPICGKECDTIYLDKHGDVFGCEMCIDTMESWDWKDQQRE